MGSLQLASKMIKKEDLKTPKTSKKKVIRASLKDLKISRFDKTVLEQKRTKSEARLADYMSKTSR